MPDLPAEVLIVEDEALVRMEAADALADRGVMAWEAGDADEALLVLDQHPRIGVVFTDVDMPGSMNGLDLAHQVSADRPDVGLIVTSGAVLIADEQLPDHGTFLPKPYPTSRLVDIVTRKLEEPASAKLNPDSTQRASS
jgi:DNA-binding NtrC family response regulator